MTIYGVIVPVVTPFTQDNKLDISRLESITEALINEGVSGVVACGTTGEYYTLSEEERELVLKTIAKVAKGRVSLIAGINDLSTQGVINKAKQAELLGYEGFMLAPPAYSLPCQQGIIAHYEEVAKNTTLPIIMYNFPARIGVDIEYDTVVHLANIPNIVGIKESSGDFSKALRMLQTEFDNFEVVCGCDDQPVDFFFWGSKSWISGSANVMPKEQVQLFNACQAQDWDKARELMNLMYPAIHSMESGNYNQKAKLGCIKGHQSAGVARLPLVDMTPSEKDEFLELLKF